MGMQLVAQQQHAFTGCVVSRRSKVSSQAVKQKDVESEKFREDFEVFVLEGSVSMDSGKGDPKPVKIMCDTCCAQSMILERSLPFSEVSATGENVLIHGIGIDVISVLFHKINLKLDLIPGTVHVWLKAWTPSQGCFNVVREWFDRCLSTTWTNCYREPCTEADNVENSCAVTRSATRKAVLDNDGDDLVPNLDLEGSFMTKLDEPGHLSSSEETSSPKQIQDSEHMHSEDSGTDP